MLRIAVQAKGRLFEETMALLEESDIKLSTTKRTLLVQSSNFPIEVLFLRDDDIPQTVATGVADLGVVGENEFMEKEEDAEIIKRLGFSKCRLSLAMPKDLEYPGLSWFNGKKIATSYPVILRNFLKEKGVNVSRIVLNRCWSIYSRLVVCSGICNIRYSSSRGCLSEAGEKCMIPDICHQSVSIECGTVCGSIWEMRYILLYVLRRSGEL